MDAVSEPAGTPAEEAGPKPSKRVAKKAARTTRKAHKQAARRARKQVPRPPRQKGRAKAMVRQVGLVLRSTHPRMALLYAVATVIATVLLKRTLAQALIAGAAVLLVQFVAGLMNDVCDAAHDRRSARPGKLIASGEVPAGNATFIACVLFLLAVPLSLHSGVTSGLILLATLPVAFLHNRLLHRTPLSFLGWLATPVMLAAFVSYADRGNEAPPTAPPTVTLAALAFGGLCLHLITSLRDLPFDHKARIKPLPLLIALKTGAPRLMWATIVLSLAAAAVIILAALGPGLHR